MAGTATVYSTKDAQVLSTGIQTTNRCNAVFVAKQIAARRNEYVILDDVDGVWLVGPRGGVQHFTKRLQKKYGFSSTWTKVEEGK